MKKSILTLSTMALAGCNLGAVSNDTQTNSLSNSVANISLVATGCQTISANGTCTVNLTYSAPAGSAVVKNVTSVSLTGLNNYNNTAGNCSTFTTTSQTCTFTITNTGDSTTTKQTALVSPNGYQNTSVSFYVGGGMSN